MNQNSFNLWLQKELTSQNLFNKIDESNVYGIVYLALCFMLSSLLSYY